MWSDFSTWSSCSSTDSESDLEYFIWKPLFLETALLFSGTEGYLATHVKAVQWNEESKEKEVEEWTEVSHTCFCPWYRTLDTVGQIFQLRCLHYLCKTQIQIGSLKNFLTATDAVHTLSVSMTWTAWPLLSPTQRLTTETIQWTHPSWEYIRLI